MTIKQAVAATTLVAMGALAAPMAPALANGTASTRNIFLAGAAATYLLIEHNRKVHQQRAAEAQQSASLQEDNNESEAAYQQERHAYQEEVATNQALEREISYQHSVIKQQDQQLAAAGMVGSATVPNSYGWGTL